VSPLLEAAERVRRASWRVELVLCILAVASLLAGLGLCFAGPAVLGVLLLAAGPLLGFGGALLGEAGEWLSEFTQHLERAQCNNPSVTKPPESAQNATESPTPRDATP
jgi:hypothetical protein